MSRTANAKMLCFHNCLFSFLVQHFHRVSSLIVSIFRWPSIFPVLIAFTLWVGFVAGFCIYVPCPSECTTHIFYSITVLSNIPVYQLNIDCFIQDSPVQSFLRRVGQNHLNFSNDKLSSTARNFLLYIQVYTFSSVCMYLNQRLCQQSCYGEERQVTLSS